MGRRKTGTRNLRMTKFGTPVAAEGPGRASTKPGFLGVVLPSGRRRPVGAFGRRLGRGLSLGRALRLRCLRWARRLGFLASPSCPEGCLPSPSTDFGGPSSAFGWGAGAGAGAAGGVVVVGAAWVVGAGGGG